MRLNGGNGTGIWIVRVISAIVRSNELLHWRPTAFILHGALHVHTWPRDAALPCTIADFIPSGNSERQICLSAAKYVETGRGRGDDGKKIPHGWLATSLFGVRSLHLVFESVDLVRGLARLSGVNRYLLLASSGSRHGLSTFPGYPSSAGGMSFYSIRLGRTKGTYDRFSSEAPRIINAKRENRKQNKAKYNLQIALGSTFRNLVASVNHEDVNCTIVNEWGNLNINQVFALLHPLLWPKLLIRLSESISNVRVPSFTFCQTL